MVLMGVAGSFFVSLRLRGNGAGTGMGVAMRFSLYVGKRTNITWYTLNVRITRFSAVVRMRIESVYIQVNVYYMEKAIFERRIPYYLCILNVRRIYIAVIGKYIL